MFGWSYIIKAKMIRVCLFTVVCILLGSLHSAQASSYNVNATVLAHSPTVAPQITTPEIDFRTSTNLVGVGGTCQVMSTAIVVSIWRNGSNIGSTMCDKYGTFFLIVGLVSGQNMLLPRSSSVAGQFGPDGLGRRVIYTASAQNDNRASQYENSVPSIVVSDAPPQQNKPTIRTMTPHVYVEPGGDAVMSIVVYDGEAPYELHIDWGDGAVENRSGVPAGTIELRHRYSQQATYAIRIRVTDVLGASTVINLASLSSSLKTLPQTNPEPFNRLWLYLVTSVVVAGVTYTAMHRQITKGFRKS